MGGAGTGRVPGRQDKRFRWGGDAIITGTVDEVVAALAARARSGVEMFIVPFGDRARPDTIRRFGDEVIPAVRAAVQGLPGRVDGESARGRAAVATGCLACHDWTSSRAAQVVMLGYE